MRVLLLLLFLTSSILSRMEARPLPVSATRHPALPISFALTDAPVDGNKTDRLVSYARQHLARRYRSGGTSVGGFDCSGFTRFCFSRVGISLPHSSAAQGTVGRAVEKQDAQAGDLIFFNGHRAGGSRIGHVGMIVAVTGRQIKFIHSAWNGGVRYDYLHADYYARRFRSIRRVMGRLSAPLAVR
jgi:murein DD-endopeptidase / murein LD-carboxypeptidase